MANGPRGIKWSQVPDALRAQYLENSWSCYLATTIANYYSLLCGSTVSYPSDSLASCLIVDLTVWASE